MPKVKIFTASQNRSRDRLAKRLKRKGYSTSSSYAISTSQIKKKKRHKGA